MRKYNNKPKLFSFKISLILFLFIAGLFGFYVCLSAVTAKRISLQHPTETFIGPIKKKINTFQKYLLENKVAETRNLFSERYKNKVSLEQFMQKDWIKQSDGISYIARLKIKSVCPINNMLFVTLFKKTNMIMYLSVDNNGKVRIEDFLEKQIKKTAPIFVNEIQKQEEHIAQKLIEVKDNFLKYQDAIYKKDLSKQMDFFDDPPISQKHFSKWGINKAISKNPKLYKLISESKDIEFRTDSYQDIVTVELKSLPVIWVWEKRSTGDWKISQLHSDKSLDFDYSQLPSFYFDYSSEEKKLLKEVQSNLKGDR